MIKFSAHGKGKKIVGFGLTEENVKRIKAGQPIEIDMAEMFMKDLIILIFYGVTEDEIYRSFKERGLLHPDITFHTEGKIPT